MLIIISEIVIAEFAPDYLIYEEDYDEVINMNKDCSYLNSSTGSFTYQKSVCEDKSFCVIEYNLPICENEELIQTIKNKSCTPCSYGCYDHGCYDSEIECENLTNCRMEANEVFQVDDYIVFGVTRMNIGQWYNFNINNHIQSIMPNIGEKQRLFESAEIGYTYYITLTKKGTDYIIFNLEKEEISTEGYKCVETDNGKDYYTYGESTMGGTLSDVCSDSTTLNEYYCTRHGISIKTYECPNGCSNGACIAENNNGNQKTQTTTNQGIGQTIRQRVKAGIYTNEAGEQIRVRELAQNRLQLIANGNQINCNNCNITQETINNRTKLKLKLSNGRDTEIKIMPNVAAQKAIQRLRLKNCNEANNCTIELKEVGQGNKTRATYEARVHKMFRLFGLFKARREILTQIDAETGETILTKRPWWSFLATEKEE